LIDANGDVECDSCGRKFRVANAPRPTPTPPPQSFSFDEVSPPPVTPGVSGALSVDPGMRPDPKPALSSSGSSTCFGIFWTLFSLVFVVVGIWIFISEKNTYNRLMNEGVTVMGQVTDMQIDYDDDSNTYYASFAFKSAGTVYNNRESVSRSYYNSLKVGDRVEVLFAASDPNLSRLKGDFSPPNALFPLIFSGMGGLFTLIGFWVIWQGLGGQENLAELRKNGKISQAIIFDKWTTRGSKGRTNHIIAFRFAAIAEDGGQIEVAHAEYNPRAYRQLTIGDDTPVRYLPTKPEVCQLVDYP
jgi:hypothetical protein